MSSEKSWVEIHFIHGDNFFVIVIFLNVAADPAASSYNYGVIPLIGLFEWLDGKLIVLDRSVGFLEKDIVFGERMGVEVDVGDGVVVEETENFGAELACASDAKDVFHGL